MDSAVLEERFCFYSWRSEPISVHDSSLLTPNNTPEGVGSAARQHAVTSYYLKRLTDCTPASGGQVKKNQLLQGQDDWAFHNEYHNLNAQHPNVLRFPGYCHQPRNNYVADNVELVMATRWERMICFKYVTGGGLDKHIQDELRDLGWATRYKIIKGGCKGIDHLHSAHDHFAKAVRESVGKLIDELIAAHDKNREGQLLHVLGVCGIGGAGKTSLVRDLFWYIYSPRMFQYPHDKTILARPLYADFGLSKMFWNNERKTTLCSIFDRVKPPSTKGLGTYGVNFSVTDSLVHHGADASGSPEMVLDSGVSSHSTGGLLNPPLDSMKDFRRYCSLLRTILSLLGNCSKAEMKNTRHSVRKSRHNRMVSRRRLAQKTRYHKQGDTRGASQKNRRGDVSRSEPISADYSSLLTPDSTPKRSWRIASAAQQHMSGYLKYLTDYTPASGDQFIDTPSMGRMPFHGSGSVNTKNMTLRDVLYVPGLEANLVSTGQLAELGYTISIGPYGCRVYKDDEGVDLVGKAHYVDGYLLELDFLRV